MCYGPCPEMKQPKGYDTKMQVKGAPTAALNIPQVAAVTPAAASVSDELIRLITSRKTGALGSFMNAHNALSFRCKFLSQIPTVQYKAGLLLKLSKATLKPYSKGPSGTVQGCLGSHTKYAVVFCRNPRIILTPPSSQAGLYIATLRRLLPTAR